MQDPLLSHPLPAGSSLLLTFGGKEVSITRPNPYTVRISRDHFSRMVAIQGDVTIQIRKDFYELPYLIKFQDIIHLAPGSTLKFFLRLPLVSTLVLSAGEYSYEVARHQELVRKGWFGEIQKGILCTVIEGTYAQEISFLEGEALIPLRMINRSEIPKTIQRLIIHPSNLYLIRAENGLFTNKIYIHVKGPTEIDVSYSPNTTKKAVNPEKLIDRKISIARTVLEKFDRFGIAKELGL